MVKEGDIVALPHGQQRIKVKRGVAQCHSTIIWISYLMGAPSYITEYLNNQEGSPLDRFLSFDICHDYFLGCRGKASIEDRIRESVLVLFLWGYLGSWGMLRGRSYLHYLNPFFLKGAIEVLDKYQILYQVDVPDYDNHYNSIEGCFNALY